MPEIVATIKTVLGRCRMKSLMPCWTLAPNEIGRQAAYFWVVGSLD
jgi:hypothetical protein